MILTLSDLQTKNVLLQKENNRLKIKIRLLGREISNYQTMLKRKKIEPKKSKKQRSRTEPIKKYEGLTIQKEQ